MTLFGSMESTGSTLHRRAEAGMHPSFLERDSQVAALLGYAAEADAGTGRLVLVQGEAGGGKSTLL
ncbi:MAG TPA: hypothetical protein VIJ15_15750, partial [Dermatophilaceae bacterium]